ncbi:hypothetical protein JRQ81_014339 [Phrynocephalus forsythii]|uniref:BEN domain-containing protein n=1 Tax=Phrynocephalus forsythii TaxID=171643 RepID=A0A9Q1B3D8_9SAUR|nr:hypothetical protein JRQ81_014339 [Phrynocephalus forsythii]
MAAKLYVLIRWPDGSRVINIENIKEPRKPFHMYAVGEQVLARCPGFTGLYWGILEGINEHKRVLEEKLQDDNKFQEMLEQATVKSSGAPQPKRSRTFLNPGNGLRQPQSDKASEAITEDAKESLWQGPPTPFGLREGHPLNLTAKSHSSVLGSPPSSCPFQVSSPFRTKYVTGITQRGATRPNQGNRDHATIATRRKSDDLVTQCQKCIDLNREEKMEQLERMVLGLHQEVLYLKQKVQRLEAASSKEPEPVGPLFEVPEHFNGYTKEQLREAIRFDQKISTACKTLLYKLFTSDYIQSHSITGRRGNTFREAKPMMDERCIKVIRVLLKQKFGDHLSNTVITEKIQNVQKALRQKHKTERM